MLFKIYFSKKLSKDKIKEICNQIPPIYGKKKSRMLNAKFKFKLKNYNNV